VKRAVWCRWLHRLRLRESTSMVSAGGGWEMRLSGGASRRYCWACQGRWYATRATRRGLAL
jgi:hypothetical protein